MKEHGKSPSEHTNAQGMQGGNSNSPTVFLSYHHSVEIFYNVNHHCGQNSASFCLQQPAKAQSCLRKALPSPTGRQHYPARSPPETRSPSEPERAVLMLLCCCPQALGTDQMRPFSPLGRLPATAVSSERKTAAFCPTQQ